MFEGIKLEPSYVGCYGSVFDTLRGLDELADFCVVFFAAFGFNTAGDIHAVGLNAFDSVGDVLRCQAASQKNRSPQFLCFDREVPIEFLTGAAELISDKGIEQ